MSYVEDKDMPLYIRKVEYKDIDIKNLSHIDAFVQKYIRQLTGSKFNTGVDKIKAEYWDQLMCELVTVYKEKWYQVIVTDENKEDIIERVLGKYQGQK